MKTEKWMSWAAFAALLVTTASCDDWGQKDPAAGNQVTPSLENVAAYDFEAEEGLDPMVWRITANPGGTAPQVIEDETKGKVLELNNGYVTLSNPLNKVVLQEAASLTFWMMQPIVMEGEGEEAVEVPQDLTSPLISFENETGNGRLYITANGGINYNAADGEWVENDPSVAATGYLTPGEWHYVAVVLNNGGYEWWVDGERKVSKEVSGFDCSKVVRFANKVPYLTIGAPENASRWMIDDLKVYRNVLTEKEIKRPNLGGGTGDDEEIDFSKWVLLGNDDNSTAFWSAWSDYVKMTGDGTIHYDFYNFHGGKNDNWNNWALVLATDGERGGDGYAEYLYLRADAYGWGNNYNGDNISHDFNWDTFMSEMDGAFVSMDIVRTGTTVNVSTVITAADGTERHYSIKVENVDQEVLSTFLTCEGSHLYIDPQSVFVGKTFAAGSNVTGATDFSSPFWGAHSELNRFDAPFANWGVEFINHTTGAGANWNNWVLVCTNGPWVGGDGYAEQFVYRSDAYGWGAAVDAGNVSCEQAFDWESYVADMKDAKVKIIFSYSNGTLTADCTQETADGRKMPPYKITANETTLPVGLFFTIDGCWLEFTRSGYYPWATTN